MTDQVKFELIHACLETDKTALAVFSKADLGITEDFSSEGTANTFKELNGKLTAYQLTALPCDIQGYQSIIVVSKYAEPVSLQETLETILNPDILNNLALFGAEHVTQNCKTDTLN